jgi:hypothetical protein
MTLMLHLCVSARQLPYERLFLRYVYEKKYFASA